VILPIALEAVRRTDALLEIEREVNGLAAHVPLTAVGKGS
jgi:hypothetical protein